VQAGEPKAIVDGAQVARIQLMQRGAIGVAQQSENRIGVGHHNGALPAPVRRGNSPAAYEIRGRGRRPVCCADGCEHRGSREPTAERHHNERFLGSSQSATPFLLTRADTKDADVVCVGDGIKLANEVAKRFNPVPQVNVFKTYGTAHIRVGSAKNSESSKVSPPTGGGGWEGAVANCHRAPAQWFNKHLMGIEEINSALDNCIHQLFHFNKELQIIFTVSPVRHIRDGVIENNRSKARLIEVVHHLANKFDRIHYFPAYELVIDVLRDYRFYDIDMVHPNYQATEFVLEKFAQHFIDESSQAIMQEVKKIVIARKHKAFQPDTKAHKQFLQNHFEKVQQLKMRCPFLDLEEEINYFSFKAE